MYKMLIWRRKKCRNCFLSFRTNCLIKLEHLIYTMSQVTSGSVFPLWHPGHVDVLSPGPRAHLAVEDAVAEWTMDYALFVLFCFALVDAVSSCPLSACGDIMLPVSAHSGENMLLFSRIFPTSRPSLQWSDLDAIPMSTLFLLWGLLNASLALFTAPGNKVTRSLTSLVSSTTALLSIPTAHTSCLVPCASVRSNL